MGRKQGLADGPADVGIWVRDHLPARVRAADFRASGERARQQDTKGLEYAPNPAFQAVDLSVKRKIVAILAADVVGYSRLVREDEEDTLHRLDRCRAVFKEFIERFGGRVVDMAGDSILAEFSTAIDAVRCAVDTQESLRTRNLDCPSDHMNFRIGISMGDVLEREGFLLGDGVNIASRLQAIAPPGGICISRSVHEAVAHKLTLKFADVGQQQLKNIPDTVHAYTAALDEQERRGESLLQAPSIRLVWGALGVVIIAGLGIGGYFLWNVENEAGSAADAHVTADAEKCTKPDVDKDEAIAACTRLLGRESADSTDTAAYYTNRGGALFTRGDYDLALKDLNEALRLNPRSALASYYRGGAYFHKRDFDRAVADLRQALDLNPNDAMSEYYMGRSLRELGRYDEAVTHLTKAIGLNARNEDFYRFRADVLFQKGDYPGAISDYDEAIRLNPRYGPAFRGRGIVRLRQKNVEQAIADLTRAIDLGQKDWYARYGRGIAYVKAGRYAEAAKDQTEALRLMPNSALILSGRADALLKDNKLTEAMRDIEQALSIDPNLAVALTTRGEILEALDRKEEAVTDFKRALAIDGSIEAAQKGLGRLEQNAPW